MIKTKIDLKAYLLADRKRYKDGIPSKKDWILHNEKWYINKYLSHLRYVEYYRNKYRRKSFFSMAFSSIQTIRIQVTIYNISWNYWG